MEIRKQLKNIVSKTFMPDFEYTNTRFSFQTVFRKTPYSYCCCSCAFEHEFLEYITESGNVYENMYNKLVQSIMNGQCPHVTTAAEDNVTKTSVSAIHIAAAIGTVEIFKKYEVARFSEGTEIFRQKVHTLIFMKKPNIKFDWSVNLTGFPFVRSQFWFPDAKDYQFTLMMTSYDWDTVIVEQMSLLEACVHQNDTKFIEPIQQAFGLNITDWFNAFDISIRLNNPQLQQLFLDYLQKYELFYARTFLQQCIASSILYSRCSLLKKILESIPKRENAVFNNEVSEPCLLLNRPACKGILKKSGFFQSTKITNSSKIFKLLNILDQYTEFQDEITDILRTIPEVQRGEIRRQLERFVTSKPKGGPRVVKVILELGGLAADWPEIIDNSLLTFVLRNLNLYDPAAARETLKLLIYENPDISKVNSAIHLGLQKDMELKSTKIVVTDLAETYQTDGEEHGLFERSETFDFALNFVVPFLLECGFSLNRRVLTEALDMQLHTSEVDYIKKCLDGPKSLVMQCRDVLRRHFRGRHIFRYLEAVNCPKRIKETVLMTKLLRGTEDQ